MISAQTLLESKNNGAVQSLVLFLLFFYFKSGGESKWNVWVLHVVLCHGRHKLGIIK